MKDITIVKSTHFTGAAEYFAGLNEGLKDVAAPYVILLSPGGSLTVGGASFLKTALLAHKADLVSCGYRITYGDEVLYETPERVGRTLSREDMLCRLFYLSNEQGLVFNKLFRSDIIRKNHLLFRTDVGPEAERLFLTQYVKKAKTIRMETEHYGLWQIDRSFESDRKELKKAFDRMKQALIFHGDARWLCKEAGEYLLEEM